MSVHVFYDTETSDRWDFRAPWNDPIQPHIVQLGYQVFDKNRELVKEVDVLVNSTTFPDWRGINPEAEKVHGISELRMVNEGLHPEIVANTLCNDFKGAHYTIAHNNGFDMGVINSFLHRCGYAPIIFEGKHNLCTMKPLTNIVKAPNKNGRPGNKWPTLQEAYMFFVDKKGFEGAHDAMVDVRACRDIFWKAWDSGISIKEWDAAKEHFNANHR